MKHFTGLFIGVTGGFFGSLVGLGGGIIMIPLMTWLGKLTQHQAHGTSLVAIVFTSIVGAVTYYFNGAVDWKAAVILTLTATTTTRFGAHYAHSLPEKKLKKFFGYFLVIASLLLIAKGLMPTSADETAFWLYITILFITGILAGFISGMMGVGGGGVMIPPMVLFAGIAQHVAQGTSLLAMVPISITGAITHHKLGNVDTGIVTGLAVGSAVGGYFGATFAVYLPEIYLKLLFAVILIWTGMRYVRTR